MRIDEAIIELVNEEPRSGALQVCREVLKHMSNDMEWTDDEYNWLAEGYALLVTLEDTKLVQFGVMRPDINGLAQSALCNVVRGYITSVQENLTAAVQTSNLERLKAQFAAKLNATFAYEFSAADIDRVQTLINELRIEVARSELFEDKHRDRLLRRLEALQSEVHKRVSDLDKFWGMIGDAGVALGKFGNDAKPIVDRIVEMSQIVWNSQKRAESLPSNLSMPLLEKRATDCDKSI